MNAEKHRLDDLLARLPLESEPSEERLAQQLAQTLARVQSESKLRETPKPRRADLALDDVLRTPLPVEMGEPNPDRLATFDAGVSAVDGFDGIFANEALDTDPLRAPLKSGEHAQLRRVEAKRPSTVSTPLNQGKRPKLFLVLGGATTFIAAAAALALFVRSERQETTTERVVTLNVAESAVVATNQPQTASEVAQPASVVAAEVESPTAAVTVEHAAAAAAAAPATHAAAKAALGKATATRSASMNAEPAAMPAKPEPELLPAAGPSELADHPTMGAIVAAVARTQGDAKRCLPQNTNGTRVALTFGSNGKVIQVAVLNTKLDTATQNCVKAALSATQLEPFAKKQYEVTLPL